MSLTEGRARRDLIIVFVDLSLFTRESSSRDDEATAALLDAYYERIANGTTRAGGTVVKFIGDGALLVFPVDRADDAMAGLFRLRQEVDEWLAERGSSSRLAIKAHAGSVIAGAFGARGDKRFDVLGDVVNTAARLPRPFHVSPQVFRLLSSEGRKLFKKHTPPVTYIPLDDRHR
jgi:adenylate cyclase